MWLCLAKARHCVIMDARNTGLSSITRPLFPTGSVAVPKHDILSVCVTMSLMHTLTGASASPGSPMIDTLIMHIAINRLPMACAELCRPI